MPYRDRFFGLKDMSDLNFTYKFVFPTVLPGYYSNYNLNRDVRSNFYFLRLLTISDNSNKSTMLDAHALD